ncbi:hypothetical protein F5Y18DRAFT_430705 [Xylariaceae sp. FL1019]|nr:hypothetical protein F5Y18DRAFT_430705 [Xylariaceae sp. FL1019]
MADNGDVIFVGGEVFAAEENPHTASFFPAMAEVTLGGQGNEGRFSVWRTHFFPDSPSCDLCLVHRRACAGGNPCADCGSKNVLCTTTPLTQNLPPATVHQPEAPATDLGFSFAAEMNDPAFNPAFFDGPNMGLSPGRSGAFFDRASTRSPSQPAGGAPSPSNLFAGLSPGQSAGGAPSPVNPFAGLSPGQPAGGAPSPVNPFAGLSPGQPAGGAPSPGNPFAGLSPGQPLSPGGPPAAGVSPGQQPLSPGQHMQSQSPGGFMPFTGNTPPPPGLSPRGNLDPDSPSALLEGLSPRDPGSPSALLEGLSPRGNLDPNSPSALLEVEEITNYDLAPPAAPAPGFDLSNYSQPLVTQRQQPVAIGTGLPGGDVSDEPQPSALDICKRCFARDFTWCDMAKPQCNMCANANVDCVYPKPIYALSDAANVPRYDRDAQRRRMRVPKVPKGFAVDRGGFDLTQSFAGGPAGNEAEDPNNPDDRNPCFRCNRLEVRCGRESPVCRRCQDVGAPCVYPQATHQPVSTVTASDLHPMAQPGRTSTVRVVTRVDPSIGLYPGGTPSCERCNHQYAECTRELPQCASCQAAGVECVYPAMGHMVSMFQQPPPAPQPPQPTPPPPPPPDPPCERCVRLHKLCGREKPTCVRCQRAKELTQCIYPLPKPSPPRQLGNTLVERRREMNQRERQDQRDHAPWSTPARSRTASGLMGTKQIDGPGSPTRLNLVPDPHEHEQVRTEKNQVCYACSKKMDRVKNTDKSCKYFMPSSQGEGEGCVRCREYGFVCVALGTPLRANTRVLTRKIPTKSVGVCDACHKWLSRTSGGQGRVCDRQRPCLECQTRGEECKGITKKGVYEGEMPGGGMPTYLSTFGLGPEGPIGAGRRDIPVLQPSRNDHLLWAATHPNHPALAAPGPIIPAQPAADQDPFSDQNPWSGPAPAPTGDMYLNPFSNPGPAPGPAPTGGAMDLSPFSGPGPAQGPATGPAPIGAMDLEDPFSDQNPWSGPAPGPGPALGPAPTGDMDLTFSSPGPAPAEDMNIDLLSGHSPWSGPAPAPAPAPTSGPAMNLTPSPGQNPSYPYSTNAALFRPAPAVANPSGLPSATTGYMSQPAGLAPGAWSNPPPSSDLFPDTDVTGQTDPMMTSNPYVQNTSSSAGAPAPAPSDSAFDPFLGGHPGDGSGEWYDNLFPNLGPD